MRFRATSERDPNGTGASSALPAPFSELCQPVEAREGEAVCAPGEALYFVRSGRVEVEIEEDREPVARAPEARRRRVGPGEFFGAVGFAWGQQVSASPVRCWSARALEDARLWRIDQDDLETLLKARCGASAFRLKGLVGYGDQLIFHG